MLVQLTYISTPSIEYSVNDFISSAQIQNKKFSITGLLVSDNNFYIQVIEGPRPAINQLYQNIIKDERHGSCTLLRYVEIRKRDFEKWSMAHTTIADLKSAYIDTITSPDDLNPHNITAVKAMVILRRIAAHLDYKDT